MGVYPKLCLATGLLLGFALLSSCATTSDQEPYGIEKFADDPRLGAKVDSICFKRNIDAFGDAHDNTIVLREGINERYRVVLSGFCPDLEFAQSIAFERQSGCARRGDFLLVSESAFSLDDGSATGPDRCFIDEIYKWDRGVKPSDEADN